ncbi:agamous-like mads-box protein agl61 [Phtheirospermum japonicum]|uniref:Agamous-like mads-box protein agl61 n=1 Tax=Phtheirospermum japonicum TaxID=374723 RepID=A0A830BRU1_9LAMI|nr:agamous-like mads-box protein agl61 [Phtheirospermum japonicum]
MEKIKSETNRQVTFSKRRVGLFKKASELHTLCGGENAVVVFSPSNKPHSFAAPNIQTITDRFLNQFALGGTKFNQTPTAHDNLITRQRNLELSNLERRLEEEKRKKKEHERIRKAYPNQIGYPSNLDLLDFDQLQALRNNIVGLKHELATLMTDATSKRTNPDAGSGGPCVGYPMDPNTQGPPSYNMADQFYYGNNGTMLNNMDPFVSDGALSNYQALFDFGGNNNPTNVGFMNDARAGYYNNPGATFFPDMVTSNHGYVDPTVNNNNGYQFPPRPNDHEAGSSNLVFPYNYGCPNEEVPNEDETGGADAEGGDGQGEGEGEGTQDEYEWFKTYNNFGHEN